MNTLHRTVLGLAATLALSACGGRPAQQAPDSGALAGGTGASSGNPTFPGVPGPGSGSDGVSNPPLANVGTPAESYSFTITGAGGTDPEFTTPEITTPDNLLRVKITPGAAGNLSLASGTYSNFSGGYGCIQYYVTVLGRTVKTKVLAVQGANNQACPHAQKSEIIDFSGRLTPGHDPIIVKVDNPSSDTKCQAVLNCNYLKQYVPYYNLPPQCKYNYTPAVQGNFCSVTPVYANYTVTGTIEVQVNGTQFAN